MKFLLSSVALFSLLYANIANARWVPYSGMTWNYVLSSKVNVSTEKAQVVDIDFENAAKIEELHSVGKKVICYFSGGTLESFRRDKDEYNKVSGLVKNAYEDWSSEIWLDFRKEGIKPLIKNRMKIAKNNKCDALEVDNLGAYLHDEVREEWSNPLTKADTIKFAKWLAETAHEFDLSIGLKNVVDIIDDVGSYFDFAINESCVLWNECYHYKNFIKQGKAVFGVTYGSLSSRKKALCSNLDGLGISMILKSDYDLGQEVTFFDGKSVCGSSFSDGFVSKSSADADIIKATKKIITTTKKTTKKTTTTKKRTTKKTTTTKKRKSTRIVVVFVTKKK